MESIPFVRSVVSAVCQDILVASGWLKLLAQGQCLGTTGIRHRGRSAGHYRMLARTTREMDSTYSRSADSSIQACEHIRTLRNQSSFQWLQIVIESKEMYPVIDIPPSSPSLKRTQREANFLSRKLHSPEPISPEGPKATHRRGERILGGGRGRFC